MKHWALSTNIHVNRSKPSRKRGIFKRNPTKANDIYSKKVFNILVTKVENTIKPALFFIWDLSVIFRYLHKRHHYWEKSANSFSNRSLLTFSYQIVIFCRMGKYYCNFFLHEFLEQRQNKNDSIQPKIIPILKLARFFPHCILGGEKDRQFQNWNYFRLNGFVLILS